jgi:tetratricopeptide (TPR) repeat protein
MKSDWMPLLPCFLFTLILASGQPAEAQSEAVAVDPAELGRRVDLVGKVVAVDDRVRFYQYHPGRGYDEVLLKRTDVVFRLPPKLRPDGPPRPMPVVIHGILARGDDHLVCDVTALKVMPNDLERLDQAIGGLSSKDFENRKAWAAWAEARGKAFKDNALIQRARSLEEEALRVEGQRKIATVDAPNELLALAEQGRRRRIAEPEPSALAHQALQSQFVAAGDIESLKKVIASIERFFPEAAKDQAAGRIDLGRWSRAYSKNPWELYRDQSTPAHVRKALDRRLWTDAVAKLLELQASLDPRSALDMTSRAETEIPEKPEFAAKLLTLGLDQARQNLGSLRLSEVRALAQTYKEKLRNIPAALELYRSWLKAQRDKLSETDAEGPLALAALYDELLLDRAEARKMLERAWKVDPGSKDVAEAFRTRGYRRVDDQWVDDAPTAAGAETGLAATEPPRSELPSVRGLRGKTPDEVSRLMASKPDGKVISGTKGQIIEQWIFLVPNQSQVRFVNFLYTPGELLPRVISDFFLPRSVIRGHLKPVP